MSKPELQLKSEADSAIKINKAFATLCILVAENEDQYFKESASDKGLFNFQYCEGVFAINPQRKSLEIMVGTTWQDAMSLCPVVVENIYFDKLEKMAAQRLHIDAKEIKEKEFELKSINLRDFDGKKITLKIYRDSKEVFCLKDDKISQIPASDGMQLLQQLHLFPDDLAEEAEDNQERKQSAESRPNPRIAGKFSFQPLKEKAQNFFLKSK